MPWPVIALVCVLAAAIPLVVVVLSRIRRGQLLARAGLQDLAHMDLPAFLRYLTTLLSGLGYQVEKTPDRSQYGVDLILTDGTGRRTAVHARHYNLPVEKAVIAEVQEGAGYHRCQDSLIVTTARYTGGAVSAAEETGAILWDLGDLADNMVKVMERPNFQQPAAPPATGPAPAPVAAAVTPVSSTPPCPICGRPTVARSAAGRDIWLCSRFPRCNGALMRGQYD